MLAPSDSMLSNGVRLRKRRNIIVFYPPLLTFVFCSATGGLLGGNVRTAAHRAEIEHEPLSHLIEPRRFEARTRGGAALSATKVGAPQQSCRRRQTFDSSKCLHAPTPSSTLHASCPLMRQHVMLASVEPSSSTSSTRASFRARRISAARRYGIVWRLTPAYPTFQTPHGKIEST